MPINHGKLQLHSDNIKKIDAAIKLSEKFLDRKAYLDLGEGQKLMTREELEVLRTQQEQGIKDSRI